ncbi:hypothetical protein [Microcoleus sp. S13_D1]
MRLNLRGEFKATIDRSNRKSTATLDDLTHIPHFKLKYDKIEYRKSQKPG